MARERSRPATYPVATAARLAGLSPDLLRAWEKRYGAVTPARGPRGARLYHADDIGRLKLLGRLVREGRRIGDVVHLAASDLEALAADGAAPAPSADGTAPIVADVFECLAHFDAGGVARTLGDALVAHGSAGFVREVAVPLLRQVGDRWAAGTVSVAEEHLLSAVLRSMLLGLTTGRRRTGGPGLLLATLPGERHELGLMLVAFLAADAGLGVHYFGAELPVADIVRGTRGAGAVAVGIGVVDGDNRTHAAHDLRALAAALPAGTELWLGGGDAPRVAALAPAAHALVLTDLDAVDRELRRLREALAHMDGHR